jgi:hypothetical protein
MKVIMKKIMFSPSLLFIACAMILTLAACKEDPTGAQQPTTTVVLPKPSPLAGNWKAQIAVPVIQIGGTVDVFFSESQNSIKGRGYALFDIPANLLDPNANPDEEFPYKLAQPLENCTASFNADSTVAINAGLLDLSILSSLGGGGGGGGGFLQTVPLQISNGKMSTDKKSISGTITFLFFPLPVTFVKQ